MDVDGEHFLVALEGVGDIRRAQQLARIELDEGISILDATVVALHEELIDDRGVLVAMETHLCRCGCLSHLLRILLCSTCNKQHSYH